MTALANECARLREQETEEQGIVQRGHATKIAGQAARGGHTRGFVGIQLLIIVGNPEREFSMVRRVAPSTGCCRRRAAATASRRRPLSSMRRTIIGPTLIMYLSGPATAPVRWTYSVRCAVAAIAVRCFFRPA